jgi:hypothetical protein
MNLRLVSYSCTIMGFFGKSTSRSAAAAALPVGTTGAGVGAPSSSSSLPLPGVEDRLRNALWSFFAGDALAAPTHWFYGGQRQIREYYGPHGITRYTKPTFELAGSILNKSDPRGGGRAKFGKAAEKTSIIGDVINHGKLDLWNAGEQVHYHATLAAGENTLEAQLARVLMRSVVQTGGAFDPDHFRNAYVNFMTTPGSHNDCYASTCHRMFFANLVYKKLDLRDCPDNDGHNVDTIDGLVLPTLVSLAVAARAATATASEGSPLSSEEVSRQSALCAGVTRRSPVLERAAEGWGRLVASALWFGQGKVAETAKEVAHSLGMREPRVVPHDEMTACYLSSAFPALLDNIVTHTSKKTGVWQALLINANTGGENVHRGSCLGAVLGAAAPSRSAVVDPPQMIQGLHDLKELEREIEEFVTAVLSKSPTESDRQVQEL